MAKTEAILTVDCDAERGSLRDHRVMLLAWTSDAGQKSERITGGGPAVSVREERTRRERRRKSEKREESADLEREPEGSRLLERLVDVGARRDVAGYRARSASIIRNG